MRIHLCDPPLDLEKTLRCGAAASDQAFQATMETAAAMSDAAFRYCSDPEFRQAVHAAWKSELAKKLNAMDQPHSG